MASNNISLLSGRSSVECTQDVSHVLHSSFHKYALHDLESDLVSNILAAKGSKDNIQETYVEALETVKGEYTRSVSTIAQLERHIMHAQTRVVSANEKNLLAQQVSSEVFNVKIKSSLRDCLDPELLEANKLISPKDFFQHTEQISAPPKASNKPNYLKSLTRTEGGSKEEIRNVLIAWADEGVDIGEHVELEETSDIKPHQPDRLKRAATDDEMGPNPHEFWKEHTNVSKRNDERNQLELLLKKTEGTKNPRFLKSAESKKTRSLVKTYAPGERPEDPTQLPPIFLANPSVIWFNNYDAGKVYEATLELRNVSAVLQSCRVTPPKSGFFGINFGEFPSENSLVAPGMACIYRIRFLPDALCEYEDNLTVYIPDRPPLNVPLIGKRPHPILNLPPSIEVGECLLAATKVCSIKLKNSGGEGKFCILPKSSWPCASLKQAIGHGAQRPVDIGDGFSVFPGTFRLKSKEELVMQLIFNPIDVRHHSTDFVVVCDNCHVKSFSTSGEGVRLQFDIAHVDGGLYIPRPSDYVDAFATTHITFPMLNLGMAFDKKISVRNNRKMDIPFVWAVVKPHLIAPLPPIEEDGSRQSTTTSSIKIPDCRIIEEMSNFTIEPQTGVMQAGQMCDFTLSYLPDKVGASHSALHLIIPGVPQPLTPAENERVSSAGKSGDSEQGVPRSAKSSQSVGVADVTALEVDLRGTCEPYNLSLNPCAIFIDGQTMIRTSTRHSFTLRNDSRGPAAFEWQAITDDDAIIEVEPKIGVLEPGAVVPLTAIVTGTKQGQISKQVPCWIEFCPEAICLQLEANFKGPEVIFREINSRTTNSMLAYLDFGLIRSTTIGQVQFLISNTSGIDTAWKLSFTSRLEGGQDDGEDGDIAKSLLKADEIQLSASGGTLQPLSSMKIELKLLPQPGGRENQRLGPRTGFLKLETEQGKTRYLQLFADVQSPDVCLQNSELLLPGNIYVDTIAHETIYLLNKTNLSTEFVWDTQNVTYTDTSECRSCEFALEPSSGVIVSKERLEILFGVKPLKRGNLEAFLTCYLPEIDQRFVLFVRGNAAGLDVVYSVFEATMQSASRANTPTPGLPLLLPPPPQSPSLAGCMISFGKFKLGEVVRRQLVIKNTTLIPANFSLEVSKFKPTAEVLKTTKESDIRRQLMSSDMKAVNEMRAKLLTNGLGLSIVAVPSKGHVTAEGTTVVEVFAVADMWGDYRDEIVSYVGDLEPDHLPITAFAQGSPLLFQMMVAQRHKTACCRFGVAVQGTAPITKKLRLLNEGPCDIRLDWRLYEVRPGDTQFIDFTYYMLDPFPEIKPMPQETRSTTNSRQSENRQPKLQSREKETPGTTEQTETAVDEAESSGEDRQLISAVVRKHEGIAIDPQGMFVMNPPQIVIKGRSHATVEVTLDPRQIPLLASGEKFVNLEAFALAFVSLTDDIRQPNDNSVKRVQWFDAETVRLTITAQIQPALLAMEQIDDDALALELPASEIVPKTYYAETTGPDSEQNTDEPPPRKKEPTTIAHSNEQKPKRQPVTLRFYNYHETDLRLTAEILAPFKIVYFGTSTRNALIDKPVSKTDEISLPAHDTLIAKIDVDPGMSMLADIDSLVPNLAVVDGRYLTMSSTDNNRAIHYRRFFTICYSNEASQSVRLSCTVPLPLVAVATKRLDFPVTLIGKSRELSFDAVNASDSDTWLQCHAETETDADRGCFRVRPTGCCVGPTAGRRVPLSVIFSPRHEGLHRARVVVIEKIIGQRFFVELSGSASFDERHALGS